MKITQEHQFLRIQLLGNGNFGAAGGKVTLDRPTQVDAFNNLPFIPNSSLRGVMKAVSRLDDNRLKAAFGIPEVNEQEELGINQPGQLVIGNGDLLAFPILADNGERCWVFPVDNIFKFMALQKLFGVAAGLGNLAGAFYPRPAHSSAVLFLRRAVALNLPFSLIPVSIKDFQEEIGRMQSLLQQWCGDWISSTDNLLIVDDHTAAFLWDQRSEIRTLTALDKTKTARGQTLRKVETVPEGSVFLSLVTWLGSGELEFESVIQFGSAEGQGLGFCRLEAVPAQNGTQAAPPLPAVSTALASPMESDADSMARIYQAISAFSSSADKSLKKKVRSAIQNFGWRAQNEGLESALAFELARAKPASTQKTPEIRAHRWLLAALFNIGEAEILSHYQDWFSGTLAESRKREVMQRWLWLRKYSEYELED